MNKLIYLAKRKPGFSFDEFIRRWRKHGALGMEQSLWRNAIGYVQAEPIHPVPLGASGDFDAVACYMITDNAFADMTEADMGGAMLLAEDELKTFSTSIPEVSLWVNEQHIKPGDLGGTTAYLFFEDTAAAREVADHVAGLPRLNRITLNTRNDKLRGSDINTLPYQAVLELSATDLPSLEAALEASDRNLVAEATVAMITRDCVLWDRLSVE